MTFLRWISWVFGPAILASIMACSGPSQKEQHQHGGSSTDGLPVLGQQAGQDGPTTIPDFRLVNQYGDTISQQDLEGKVYVADFFFATCPTICPKMTRQLLRVHEVYREQPDVVLLSHTIDPEHDSVAVLREYAERHGVARGSGWHFLTGSQDRIYELAEDYYMVAASEDSTAPGGYAHSGAFILIDRQDRIRGYYNGTDPEDVDRLIADIRKLLPVAKSAAYAP